MKISKQGSNRPGLSGTASPILHENHSSRNTPGIKEIAKAAGVSIGTVDRALHSRPGINPVTRAKIVQTAESLGYRPNLAARYLKLGHQKTISIHLPQQIASFFDTLREGIRQAAAQFRPELNIEFKMYPRIGQGEVESVRAALGKPFDGIILAPSSRSTPLIRKATSRGIPVVCVATDAPHTDRLTAVCCDPFISGAVAAELFTRTSQGNREIAILTGDLSTFDHSEKVRGFRSMLQDLRSAASLVKVAETHDSQREAYQQTCKLLARHPKLAGLYVSTANSLPVIKALEENAKVGKLTVVLTDLFPEVVPLIRSGKALATIYQRPFTQGRLAFEALYHFLMEGVRPRPIHKLAPHIVLRSNLDLFVENSLIELRDRKLPQTGAGKVPL